jgi:hypothetical protein
MKPNLQMVMKMLLFVGMIDPGVMAILDEKNNLCPCRSDYQVIAHPFKETGFYNRNIVGGWEALIRKKNHIEKEKVPELILYQIV